MHYTKDKIIELKNIGFSELHSHRDIMFVESRYDNQANDFIFNNYELISRIFSERKLCFRFVPKVIEEIFANKKIVDYYCLKSVDVSEANKLVDNGEILKYSTSESIANNTPPSLLMTTSYLTDNNEDADKHYYAILVNIPLPLSMESISQALAELISIYKAFRDECQKNNASVLYRKMGDADSFWDGCDDETHQLINEIKDRMERLHQKGIKGVILNKLISELTTPSRLTITSDYRVFLNDFDNKEIVMPSLPKTVFLLFLRHPEGIAFKCLADYKYELMSIYKKVCKGNIPNGGERSIENICDPLNNSINEKCSRIAEAFKKKFDVEIINPYIIQGERGTAKRIVIDRNLVSWECADLNNL